MADEDNEFDPDAPIPSAEEDPEIFDDVEAREAIRRELVALAALGSTSGPESFTYFHRSEVPVCEGEFFFKVVQNQLKVALATTSLTAAKGQRSMANVKVTLFRDRLKLQTYDQTSFSEYLVPLVEPSPSIPVERVDELAVAFIIDQKTFYKVMKTVPDPEAILDFTYHVATETLQIQVRDQDGELHLDHQLPCRELIDFWDYHKKLPSVPQKVGELQPEVWQQAVKFVSLFPKKKNEHYPRWHQIEARGGMLLGGTDRQVGAVTAAALQALNIKVRLESLQTFEKMLGRCQGETLLFETDSYFLLRDAALTFGFERSKPDPDFPPVEPIFQRPSDNHILARRDQLGAYLANLQCISEDRDFLVSIRVTGCGKGRLQLSVLETRGRPCRAYVEFYRKMNEGMQSEFPDWQFSVTLGTLLKVVQHFKSPNVHMEVYPNEEGEATGLYIYDEEDGLVAHSWLRFLTPYRP